MSGQVSRCSAGEYQADERAGVARLSWRVSGRVEKIFEISGIETNPEDAEKLKEELELFP